MAQRDQSNILERDFYGYAGAGPLTVAVGDDGQVHIGLGDSGLYLDGRAAFQLAHFLEQAATEARLREQELM